MQWTALVAAIFAASAVAVAVPKEETADQKLLRGCWWCGDGIENNPLIPFNPYIHDPFGPFTFNCDWPGVYNPLCPRRGRQDPLCFDGDQNGCYLAACKCSTNKGCDLLHNDYGNIYTDPFTGACMDHDQRGIEFNGFSDYCDRAGGFVSGCIP